MTQTKQRFSSFEEYLDYDDGTENVCELFNGELIEVPPESGLNVGIAAFLFAQFLPIVGHLRVRIHSLEIEVRGEPRNRFPDLTIIREEHIAQLKRRNTIRLSMAPPLLVVEVVSPGDLQRDRDYIAKLGQYGAIAIPEYWIVDPETQVVSVCELIGGTYEMKEFRGSDRVQSQLEILQSLQLTAQEILKSGSE
ncbi:Uma2 family endonuclease [Phormidesmis priestleyi]